MPSTQSLEDFLPLVLSFHCLKIYWRPMYFTCIHFARSVERFVLGRDVFLFSFQPHFKIFFPCPSHTPLFYLTYGLIVNLNSCFHTFYGVDPTVERVGYVYELLARLLFIYEDNVHFEVIWFLKKQ